LLYLPQLDREGRLVTARLVPMQLRQFRLNHASAEDARWLCAILNRFGEPFGTKVGVGEDNSLNWLRG
jgi:hypothetical protein